MANPYPLQASRDDWEDVRHHYEDPDDHDGEEMVCEDCGVELEACFDPIGEGLCASCAIDNHARNTEPISEDAMRDDFDRAVDELQGLYPPPDDHDRRYEDFYSQQQGDLGDEQVPF